MSPIEHELREWDRAFAEDTNAFRTVVTKFGHKDSADFVNKLISFIRHQQEVTAKMAGALEYIAEESNDPRASDTAFEALNIYESGETGLLLK